METISPGMLLRRIQDHDWRALGRAITLVEEDGPEKDAILQAAFQSPRSDCLVIGLTGAGGAGKSTLIDQVISAYRGQEKTVGVLAVDPSSPYTGGAFLGDRIRMGRHSTDHSVFIRSFASRGSLGGISQEAKDALYLYKAYGFDVIILETLGAGQAETDIRKFVDVTAVVLAPGNGDDIQMAKAGIQEIADIFVLNKADRPEVERLYAQLSEILGLIPEEERPQLVKTIATVGNGIQTFLEAVQKVCAKIQRDRRSRECERIRDEISSTVLVTLKKSMDGLLGPLSEQVLEGEITPQAAIACLRREILCGELAGTAASMAGAGTERLLYGKKGAVMELKKAIFDRKSIRGYLPKAVSQKTMQDILRAATRAVSALNMQPWSFLVVSGAPLDEIRKRNMEDLEAGVAFDVPEPEFGGVYRERRVAIAKQLFKAMDIQRGDKERRKWWLERGFRFFDAPVLVLVLEDTTVDSTVSRLDIGCVTQNLCYAAMTYGLGTCVQSQAVMLQRGIREVLSLPENRYPAVGIALGYPDPDFPANQVVSMREDVSQITQWFGF